MTRELVRRQLERYEAIERNWLHSLGISATEIPDGVVASAYMAHAARRYPESVQWLIENMTAKTLIEEALEGIDDEESD